jgi:hypothetical protein
MSGFGNILSFSTVLVVLCAPGRGRLTGAGCVVGKGAPWLFLRRSFELNALRTGSFARLAAAAFARAEEGLWTGLREPAALAPDCVWTVVRGLNVTVRCGRGAGARVAAVGLFGEEVVGKRGEDSSIAVAMTTGSSREQIKPENELYF